MAVNRKSLPLVVFRITSFWWCVFTVAAFGMDPGQMIGYFTSGYPGLVRYIYLIGFTSVIAVMCVWLAIHFTREWRRMRLGSAELMGLTSSKGKLPLPNPPMPRISNLKERIPITGDYLNKWLASQHSIEPGKKKGDRPIEVVSPHGRLFLAIWDTYCAHSHYPASHLAGGHGDKRLHDHCHDVAERALKLVSEGWTYTGIYVKKRGRKAVQIMQPNSKDFKLNPLDPIIPIVALAHDIGKLKTYEVDRSGRITDNQEEDSNTLDDDDARVLHDILGPRILALMTEYWSVNHRDRSALNLALAHYHHPGAFPVTRHQLLLDERAAAVMALLIDADRTVSAEESGLDSNSHTEDLDEDQTEAIFNAFVRCVTPYGRINGTGDKQEDAANRIGQKHGSFIVLNEKALRAMMLKELGWSLDGAENRYFLTIKLLTLLKSRDLLYDKHDQVDFSAYLPMYRVSIYHHAKGFHLVDIAPAIVMKVPPVSMEELKDLAFLEDHPARAVIKYPMLTHLKTIKNREKFEADVRKAFGDGSKHEMLLATPSNEDQAVTEDASGATPELDQNPSEAFPEGANDEAASSTASEGAHSDHEPGGALDMDRIDRMESGAEEMEGEPQLYHRGAPGKVETRPGARSHVATPSATATKKPLRLGNLAPEDKKAMRAAGYRRRSNVDSSGSALASKDARFEEEGIENAQTSGVRPSPGKSKGREAADGQMDLTKGNPPLSEKQRRALFGD